MAKSNSYVAKLMESIAVIKVAIGVKRAKLMSLHQDHDELFRERLPPVYAVKQKSAILIQSVTLQCDCGKSNATTYTEEAIKDVMLAGDDITREVLKISYPGHHLI